MIAADSRDSGRCFSMPVIHLLPLLWICVATPLSSQSLPIRGGALTEEAALVSTIGDLARRALEAYQDNDRQSYLNNAFRMQLAAEEYADAARSLNELVTLAPDMAGRVAPFRLFAAVQQASGTFERVFENSFPQR